MKALYCFAIGALLSIGASESAAQEWTRFRGPNGTGINEQYAFPGKWSENDYHWKIPLPGIGHSSPVIWGNRVFVTSADPKNATQYLLCVDLASGKVQWQREFPCAPHHLHSRSSFASSTPVVDAERVYFAFASPEAIELRALNHEGHDVWTRNLGTFVSQHGFGSSPILFEELLIFSNSQQEQQVPEGKKPGKSTLMALEKRTGKTVWSLDRTSERVCYPVPYVYQNAKGVSEIIHYNTGDGFYGVNPHRGTVNWLAPKLFRMRTVSSPVLAGGLLFGSTGSGGGGNYIVAIKPGPDPKIMYTIDRQAPYVPTPVAKAGLLFLFYDKGIVTCIEASTGKIHWKERLNTAFSGSPVRVRDKLFCIDEEGVVIVLAADKSFKELGRNPLGDRSRATPAVAGGRMLLRTYSYLFCLGGKGA